jgi:hypothetical protein
VSGHANQARDQSGVRQYAAEPSISGMVNAAKRDRKQRASDVTLPAIDRTVAMSGDADSPRAGIASGLVERALAQHADYPTANLRVNLRHSSTSIADRTRERERLASYGFSSIAAERAILCESAQNEPNGSAIKQNPAIRTKPSVAIRLCS